MEAMNQTTSSPPSFNPRRESTTSTTLDFQDGSSGGGNGSTTSAPPTVSSREQMRIDFYRTYDVMTGVRIAATLGGFFSLMVLLVVYKSKCKSKSLSDEHLNAAAAAVAIQDEEEQLAAALDAAAASFYSRTMCTGGGRRSLGNMSAPALVLTRGGRRFSSIGGYTTLEPPSCYYYQRGKSLPGSALRFHMRSADEEKGSASPVPSFRDRSHNDVEEEEEDSVTAGPCCYHQFLTVPSGQDARRLSSITCSSSDTSYLERRGSAVELGIPAPPPFPHRSRGRGRLNPDINMAEEPWDFYYPIDIQVIQPTPEVSPCGSERTLYDHPMELGPHGLRPPSRGSVAESTTSSLNVSSRLAPLASISSIGGSLTEYPDFDDIHSVGSDSVFLDEGEELDTEDEVEGFSTDSEDDGFDTYRPRRPWEKIEDTRFSLSPSPPPHIPYSQHFLQVPSTSCHRSFAPLGHWGVAGSNGFRPRRRLSAPGCHYSHSRRNKSSCATISAKVAETAVDAGDLPSSSRSCERLGGDDIAKRAPYPLPPRDIDSTSSSDSLTLLTHSRTCSPRRRPSKEKQPAIQQQPPPSPPPEPQPQQQSSSSPYRSVKSCESLLTKSIPSPSSKMLALPSFPLLARGSCEHLIRALNEKTSAPPLKNCSWSQETLF
ncbi:uncharacterized protein [Periplaneta americana]|uniref:uncharacterized protein n=1 Tax=Periplaneta americana TaxID=6978 RepID=UPI0037E941E1